MMTSGGRRRRVVATALKKPVTREVGEWCKPGMHGVSGRRALLVTLNPAGFIEFRLKGTRKGYDLGFESAFLVAVRKAAADEKAEKATAKKKRKEGLS